MAYVHIDDKFEPYLDIMIDCIKLKGADIEKQIKRITEDTTLMDECLEEKFLSFKLHAKNVRDEYEKAVTDTILKTEAVWSKCEDLVNNSMPTINKAVNSVISLSREVKDLNDSLDRISIYKAEKLIELIEKFNSMSTHDKEILSKLLEISKD